MTEHVPLSAHSTFRIGGAARHFTRASDVSDIERAVSSARSGHIPFFILGGGSNILFSDDGFDGLIIRIGVPGISFERLGGGKVRAIVGAGEQWDDTVCAASENGLWGLENLSYIPGTAGGAVVQNAGAYGVEASDAVEWVEALDLRSMRLRVLSRDECGFGYRTSIFKKQEDAPLVVARVALILEERGTPRLSYKDLGEYFKGRPIPRIPDEMREAVISIRRRKLPEITDMGTAGSFFENPIITKAQFDSLAKKFPAAVAYARPSAGNFKLSAGYLLDAIGGWKGYRKGDAGVYDKHALVLVNHGAAHASDMEALAEAMMSDIKKKTGITLRPEVEIFSQRNFFLR